MSHHAFDPNCPDCRPVLLDRETGSVLLETDPIMHSVLAIWKGCTREEQEAFHRVTMENSRDPDDLEKMEALAWRIEQAATNREPAIEAPTRRSGVCPCGSGMQFAQCHGAP